MTQEKMELWLSEARNDFKGGDILYNSKIFNLAVFHYIQAAKKGIKSLLHYFDAQPWCHNVFDLIVTYKKLGHDVNEDLIDLSRDLYAHYTASRYPDLIQNKMSTELYNEKNTQSIREKAKKILNFIEKEKEVILKHGNKK